MLLGPFCHLLLWYGKGLHKWVRPKRVYIHVLYPDVLYWLSVFRDQELRATTPVAVCAVDSTKKIGLDPAYIKCVGFSVIKEKMRKIVDRNGEGEVGVGPVPWYRTLSPGLRAGIPCQSIWVLATLFLIQLPAYNPRQKMEDGLSTWRSGWSSRFQAMNQQVEDVFPSVHATAFKINKSWGWERGKGLKSVSKR